jgi:hypothetical protein
VTVPTLPTFHRPFNWPEIDDIVRTDGGAILAGFLSPEELHNLNQQFDRFIEQHDQVGRPTSRSDGYNTFLGRQTIRLHGLMEKAPASADLIGNPDLVEWATRHIAPDRAPGSGAVVLNAAELIQIEPSESRQAAHRDTDSWPEAPNGDHPLAVNAIVALDPFTLQNGATYVAPGSWQWDRDRRATAEEYARATMDAGDAVLFRGDLIHRGGENLSDKSRRAISISYSAGWLRPVENSFLNLSAETIAGLTPRLQALIGFQAHDATDQGGGLLGLYENGDPADALPARP